MTRIALVLMLAALGLAAPAEAGRARKRPVLIPANACPVGQTYKVVIKRGIYDKTVASVPCSTKPQCVEIAGGWPDDSIYGRVGSVDVLAVPAKAGDVCP